MISLVMLGAAMMPDRHKRRPVAVRLPEDLEDWLREAAGERDMKFNALVVAALQAYRSGATAYTRPAEPAVAPQPGKTVTGYSKERQARGKR